MYFHFGVKTPLLKNILLLTKNSDFFFKTVYYDHIFVPSRIALFCFLQYIRFFNDSWGVYGVLPLANMCSWKQFFVNFPSCSKQS